MILYIYGCLRWSWNKHFDGLKELFWVLFCSNRYFKSIITSKASLLQEHRSFKSIVTSKASLLQIIISHLKSFNHLKSITASTYFLIFTATLVCGEWWWSNAKRDFSNKKTDNKKKNYTRQEKKKKKKAFCNVTELVT